MTPPPLKNNDFLKIYGGEFCPPVKKSYFECSRFQKLENFLLGIKVRNPPFLGDLSPELYKEIYRLFYTLFFIRIEQQYLGNPLF